MIVKKIPSGPLATNAYFVLCERKREAIFIDPAPESAAALLDYATQSKATVKGIYLTHSHFDHIHDAAKLKRQLNISVFVHKDDAENLRHVGFDGLPDFLSTEGVKPDGFLEDGQIFLFGEVSFRVIHTPGHSPGSVCFYSENERALFSGDTLFKKAHGRVDLPTGNSEAMEKSLQKLVKLPPEVVVYPGHGTNTTIEDERRWI